MNRDEDGNLNAEGCTVAKPQRPTQRGRQRSGKPALRFSCVSGLSRSCPGPNVIHGVRSPGSGVPPPSPQQQKNDAERRHGRTGRDASSTFVWSAAAGCKPALRFSCVSGVARSSSGPNVIHGVRSPGSGVPPHPRNNKKTTPGGATVEQAGMPVLLLCASWFLHFVTGLGVEDMEFLDMQFRIGPERKFAAEVAFHLPQ
jgi:hypothetical protein